MSTITDFSAPLKSLEKNKIKNSLVGDVLTLVILGMLIAGSKKNSTKNPNTND